MRQAAIRSPRVTRQPQSARVSNVVSISAPTGGWNARDALTDMAPNDAITLDNFIPGAIGVRLRNGYETHATDLAAHVESLMEYSAPDGTEELFAAANDNIFDVTDAGAGDIVLSGLTNGRWQHVNFATTGGNFLVACNGEDSVQNYDGSTWAAPIISSVPSTSLINVAVHFARLWFVEKDKLDAWYLPTAAVSGNATKFPLGSMCKLGGHLVAIASWTRDGGSGLDDMLVFITSKGEAIIYQGTDPDDDTTWFKKGVFRIPEPIGRRCVVNIGSDLGLITSQGVLPFSVILPLSGSGAANVAITDKISRAFYESYIGGSTKFGWQVIEFPKERLLIVNIPVIENTSTVQYVMNTQTGAWCRFTGLLSNCWGMLGDDMYFGGDGVVYKVTEGFDDDGVEINGTSISAYTDLGNRSVKRIVMARPMASAIDGYLPRIGLRVDYDLGAVTYFAATAESSGEFWDEGEWDVAEWGLSIVPSARWRSMNGVGTVVSFALAASTKEEFQYHAVDLMAETGGFL